MEEILKQLLQAELAKAQAAATPEPVVQKAETPAAATTPAFDMAKLVEMLAPAISTAVETEVQKALPAPAREEGKGRVGTVDAPKSDFNSSVKELVAKAHKPADLSETEKRAIWALTEKVLGRGLKKSSEDED